MSPRCRFGAPACRFWWRCQLARRNLHLGGSMFSRLKPVRCRLCRFFGGTLFFLSARSCSPRTPPSILFTFFLKKNLHNLHSDPKPAECLGFFRVGLGQNPSRTCTEPALGCRRPGLEQRPGLRSRCRRRDCRALGLPESAIELRKPD